MRAVTFLGPAFLVALTACRTSQEIARDRDTYVDPTNVKTTAPEAPVLSDSVENLKRELAVTQGELENTRTGAQQEKEALNARIATLEQENAKLKTTAAAAPAPDTSAESPETSAPVGKKTATALWDLARHDLKEGRVKEALVPLGEITKTYAKDPHAYRALLLLGMSQYRTQNYKEAALAFNQAIDKFPKKPETVLAWFGQGAAFVQMGQFEDSKLFFNEITKKYPKSPEAREAARILRKKRAPTDLFATFNAWSAKVLK